MGTAKFSNPLPVVSPLGTLGFVVTGWLGVELELYNWQARRSFVFVYFLAERGEGPYITLPVFKLTTYSVICLSCLIVIKQDAVF